MADLFKSDLPIGKAIRDIRERRSLSQEHVARYGFMNQGNLSAIERGARTPNILQLDDIARGLNVSLWELVKHACRLRVAQRCAAEAAQETAHGR